MEKTKAAYHSRDGVVPNPKSKLLDQVRDVIRVKHYSIRTEDAYVQWIKRFIFFHGKRHPREMGAVQIEAFLTDLAVQKQVAASTQNQALNALVFLYQQVLHMELGEFSAVRAKRSERLPLGPSWGHGVENGIRIKRRGAENSELRGGEAAEVAQRVSCDWPAALCGSPRSQRLCVKVSQASTPWTRLSGIGCAESAGCVSAGHQSRGGLKLSSAVEAE